MKWFGLAACLVLAFSRRAPACSCIEIPGDPNAPVNEYVVDDPNSVVVLGTIESVRFEGDWPEDYKRARQAPTIATVQIDRYWGDAKITDHLEIRTENVGPGCGVPWNTGDCYLVEAWRPEGSGTWQSSTCSITTRVVANTSRLNQLILTDGPGKIPR